MNNMTNNTMYIVQELDTFPKSFKEIMKNFIFINIFTKFFS